MKVTVLSYVVLEAFFAATAVVVKGREAHVFLESQPADGSNVTYKLNGDVLKQISKLQGPIQVIAAVGNARVGKSTTLNLISHFWDEIRSETGDTVEQIFKTGNSIEAVTRDVWAHIIQPQSQKGSILLLDVEGTDLGDDSVTDHLSMFTAMMASGLNIFARDIVGNSDIDFLYRISVLSEIVFPNISLENFPKLCVVMRSDLGPPKGQDIQDFIRDSILNRKGQGTVIKKYFPRDSIAVSQIPYVKDTGLFQDYAKLRNSSYWRVIANLTEQLKNTQVKKTFNGSSLDGTALVMLAESLQDAMNSNSWPDFGNSYVLIEKELCRRRKEELAKTAAAMKANELETKMLDIFESFSKRCRLQSEINSFKNELLRILENHRKREEEDRKRKSKDDDWLTWVWNNKYFTAGLGFLTGAFYFSDERLKQDIVTMPSLPIYSDIGLNGVCWKWNKIAEARFGLTGEGCGVIAQDVERLFPWAVIRGRDGYLRVSYNLLLSVWPRLHCFNVSKRN